MRLLTNRRIFVSDLRDTHVEPQLATLTSVSFGIVDTYPKETITYRGRYGTQIVIGNR